MYKYLIEERKANDLGRQVLRSGTSIGANIEEGIGGQSKADFISKMNIAYKEARETNYWIRLLCDTEYIELKLAESFWRIAKKFKKYLQVLSFHQRNRNF